MVYLPVGEVPEAIHSIARPIHGEQDLERIVEHVAHKLTRFFVTASDMRRVIGAGAERLQRAIGVVYRPETERRSHYVHARLADELDIVIHIESARALEPLDPLETRPTPVHELPDATRTLRYEMQSLRDRGA